MIFYGSLLTYQLLLVAGIFLKAQGYCYFFGVSKKSQTLIEPKEVVFERFPMDGRSLRQIYPGAEVFVNPKEVFDPERPMKLK